MARTVKNELFFVTEDDLTSQCFTYLSLLLRANYSGLGIWRGNRRAFIHDASAFRKHQTLFKVRQHRTDLIIMKW